MLYRDGETYYDVSDESPKGFKGELFIAMKGDSPTNLEEEVIVSKRDIGHWEKVEATTPEPEPEPEIVIQIREKVVIKRDYVTQDQQAATIGFLWFVVCSLIGALGTVLCLK